MSMDPSLKSASSLVRHRNVLTRAERLDRLKAEEKWNETKSPLGLPKVGHRKLEVGKPVKEEAAEGAVAGAAAPAAGAKGAAGAKAAAPAAGAKGAAPAAGAKGAAPAKAAAPAAKKK